jgi:hypothetical protein
VVSAGAIPRLHPLDMEIDMILATIRLAKDTDKSLLNREFTNLATAQSWCNEAIGDYSDKHGLVEFILLTDYSTMRSEEYEIENGGN